MKVLLFEAFTNDHVQSVIDELEAEVASSRMRIGPSMDKLPWAMEVVVFEFIKDRCMEANSSNGAVSIEDVIAKLEEAAETIKQDAVDLLISAGMGEDEISDAYETGYKVVKLKNYDLIARPIDGKRGIQKDIEANAEDKDLESTVSPNSEVLDKEFRSARNRGRNIVRKNLNPEEYRKPVPKKVKTLPKLTVRKVDPLV